ncbi:unnamed protein product [Calicophoron daubneyi]|uniref:Uncharacterized protein n=1 Tax=Calicophoron daubneyi TaxID=300641 RepID=A0AAV2THG9_CALDB
MKATVVATFLSFVLAAAVVTDIPPSEMKCHKRDDRCKNWCFQIDADPFRCFLKCEKRLNWCLNDVRDVSTSQME